MVHAVMSLRREQPMAHAGWHPVLSHASPYLLPSRLAWLGLGTPLQLSKLHRGTRGVRSAYATPTRQFANKECEHVNVLQGRGEGKEALQPRSGQVPGPSRMDPTKVTKPSHRRGDSPGWTAAPKGQGPALPVPVPVPVPVLCAHLSSMPSPSMSLAWTPRGTQVARTATTPSRTRARRMGEGG